MGTRTGRWAATVGMLGLLAALSACAYGPQPVVTRLPTDGAASAPATTASAAPTPAPSTSTITIAPAPVPSSPAPPPSGSDCGGRAVTLTDGSPSLVLSGDCPDVQVQGAALVVDLRAASIGSLTVSGDRVSIAAGDVGALTLRGNDNEVNAQSVQRAGVQGDRNAVAAVGAIASVQFDGNDNAVRSGTGVGAVVDNGGRNTVG